MTNETNPVPPGVASPDVEAEYAIETSARCPHCRGELNAVHVVRLLRTRVNFVSSLPRRGHVMVCPGCQSVLGGSVGGLL